MKVAMRVPEPRQLLHLRYCPALGACRFVGGLADTEQYKLCRGLDELLDFNDEMVLHDGARKLKFERGMLTDEGSRELGEGMEYAIELIDPYEHVPGAAPHIDGATEKDPDCPACADGRGHYHRKADGKRVMSPREA